MSRNQRVENILLELVSIQTETKSCKYLRDSAVAQKKGEEALRESFIEDYLSGSQENIKLQ